MLRMGGDEMHKSIGNVVTLRDAIDRWGRETLLVFFMTGPWRKPLDFTEETLSAAAARTERLREVFRNASEAAPADAWERFTAALDDDFNTPDALAVMHEWRDHDLLRRALDVFGLGSLAEHAAAPPDVVELAERRMRARAARDYAESDRLRDEIAAAGWEVRDVSEPPLYRLVRRG